MTRIIGLGTRVLVGCALVAAAAGPAAAQTGGEPARKGRPGASEQGATLEALAKRVRENPDSATALAHYGMALIRSGMTEDGLASISRARVKDPDDPEVRILYAKGLWKTGYPVQAIEEASLATKSVDATQSQIADALFVSGTAKMMMGDSTGAEQDLLRSLELAPFEANALFNLGLIFASSDRFPQAMDQFERAIRSAPRDVKLIGNVATIYSDRISPAKGIELWERVVSEDPTDPKLLYGLGRACVDSGNFAKALPVYGKLSSMLRDDPNVRLEFARLLARFSYDDKALLEAREAERLGADASKLITLVEERLAAAAAEGGQGGQGSDS